MDGTCDQQWWPRLLIAAAFGASIIGAVAALFVPAYSDGATVLQKEGAGAVAVAVIPAIIAALSVLAYRRGSTRGIMASAAAMIALVAATGFSVGLYFAPAALLLLLAAVVTAG